jgi:DNA-binding LacI/PurR family transcriptional regulator
MVTIDEVAKRAGVSSSTVSYALSGKRSISPETRERIDRVIHELNYRPLASAQALASGRANALALVVPFRADNNVPVILQHVMAIATAARKFGHDVLLVTEEEGDEGLRRVSASSLVDGVIVMDIEGQDSRLPTLRKLGLPCALLGVPDEPRGLSCIDVDMRETAALAVRHLYDLGHRSIAMLGSPPSVYERGSSYARHFAEGFESAVSRASMVAQWHPTEQNYDAVSRLLSDQLKTHPDTTALIVHNEAVLGTVLAILDKMALHVPQDISVVAVCPSDMAVNQRVALTNIDIQAHVTGTLAVDMVLRQLQGDKTVETRLVAPQLTARESTATARTDQMGSAR